MSGRAGFHHSSGDIARSFAGSRTLGHDRRQNAMSEIMGGGGGVPAPPPPRQSSQVASLFDGEEEALPRANRRPEPRSASVMDDVMRGVGVPDPARGPLPNLRHHSGSSVLAALRPDDPSTEEAGADPFAHVRVRSKSRGPMPVVAASETTADAPAPKAGAPTDTFIQALAGVHRDFSAMAASAPRDSGGALVDYRPLLTLLTDRGLPLNADAAGTLIAHVDVHRSVTYDTFVAILAGGMADSDASDAASASAVATQAPADALAPVAAQASVAPMPPPSGAQYPVSCTLSRCVPRVQPTAAFGAYNPSQWTMSRPAPPALPADAKAILAGSSATRAATNAELAALMNAGLNKHARRSDAEYSITLGKSAGLR